MKSNITNLGVNPEEVLGKGKQFVHVENDSQGFADNEQDVLNIEFEKMYNQYMNSPFIEALDKHPDFQKWKEAYENMDIDHKKQFLKYCLIDMITLHLNAINEINQMQQDLFADDYSSEGNTEPLDARWFDIYIYQITGMAIKRNIPGPMQAILNQKPEEEGEKDD